MQFHKSPKMSPTFRFSTGWSWHLGPFRTPWTFGKSVKIWTRDFTSMYILVIYSHGMEVILFPIGCTEKNLHFSFTQQWFTSSVYPTLSHSDDLEIRIVACPSLNLPFWFEPEAEITTQNSKPNPQNLGDSIIISELIMFCSLWRHDFVTQAHMT